MRYGLALGKFDWTSAAEEEVLECELILEYLGNPGR